MTQTFIFSEDGKYRYLYAYQWNKKLPRVCFIMLNPTDADIKVLNSTLRRCINYAKNWGFGSIDIVNLYALIEPNPKDLFTASQPEGAENDFYILKSIKRSKEVILAWGNYPQATQRVEQLLRKKSLNKALCLKKNKSGTPAHPLYLKKDLRPMRFF